MYIYMGLPNNPVGKESTSMQESPVQFLCQEDPFLEGKDYPLQYSGLENSMDYSLWDCKESDMTK